MRVVLFEYSSNRVTAKGFPFAGLAVLPNPNLIKLVHGLLNQLGIVGEDASFEVARSIAFHADACASKVGAADVGYLVIKDQYLEMHPWTKRPFQTIKQSRMFVKVLTECRAWFLGMDKSHLDILFYKLSQHFKEWFYLRPDFDIKVLDVGGANP